MSYGQRVTWAGRIGTVERAERRSACLYLFVTDTRGRLWRVPSDAVTPL